MKSLINRFVIPLPFLLVIFGTMLSAGTAGKISGKVLDENGDPLIGCNIILKGTLIGTSSNELGDFRAGFSASIIGIAPAIMIGGMLTVSFSIIWWFLFPGLKEVKDMKDLNN